MNKITNHWLQVRRFKRLMRAVELLAQAREVMRSFDEVAGLTADEVTLMCQSMFPPVDSVDSMSIDASISYSDASLHVDAWHDRGGA